MKGFGLNEALFYKIMIEFKSNKNAKLSKLVLENVTDISFGAVMKVLRNKDVKVNGKRVNKDISLSVGDLVEIYFSPVKKEKFVTLFSNSDILVINKKSGYSSEEVFADIFEINPCAKFIHRLDRNTAGLMIFALNESAEKELLYGFKYRTFDKFYTATVIGCPKEKNKILTAYLIKNADSKRVTVYEKKVVGATEIKTGYEVVSENGKTSVLKIKLVTGKTHQIRAHLAFIGHPIVGDGKYGDYDFNKKSGVKSQMLTASELVLHFNKESPLYYLNGKRFTI